MLSKDLQRLIQNLFFQFMTEEGYLSDKEPETNRYRLGSKSYTASYENGMITIIDDFFAGENLVFTSGYTVVYYNGLPVWQLVYSGHYLPEALAILKRAISGTMQRNVFRAGRGPSNITIDGLKYLNQSYGSFVSFECLETITRVDDGLDMGHHQIDGGWMVSIEE